MKVDVRAEAGTKPCIRASRTAKRIRSTVRILVYEGKVCRRGRGRFAVPKRIVGIGKRRKIHS